MKYIAVVGLFWVAMTGVWMWITTDTVARLTERVLIDERTIDALVDIQTEAHR